MSAPINPSIFVSQAPFHRPQGLFSLLKQASTAPSTSSGGTVPQQNAEDTVTLGQSADTQASTELTSVQKQFYQMSLVARFQQVAQSTTTEDGQQVETQARQLEFKFSAKLRSEAVQRFTQRTGAVADNLDGDTRTSFQQVSRQVATRFKLSLSVSGSVLNGFAGSAEQLQNGDNSELDALLGFTKDLLGKADELLNQAFDTINGFLSGDTTDFADRITKIFSDLQDLFSQQSQLPGQTGTSGTQQTSLSFKFSFQLEFSFAQQTQVQESDPLTLDLDGDGIELSHYSSGAKFDLSGKGSLVQTAFVNGGDAFLALDRNGNGSIDSGLELFGDQHGAANGYEELRKLDSNGDGKLNGLDKQFDALRVFKDNGNGRTDPGELLSLAQAGIAEIGLNYQNTNFTAGGGNRIGQLGSFLRHDGSRGVAGDAWLKYLG